MLSALNQTSVPEGDARIPRPYLHGYLTDSRDEVVDVSEQGGDPSNTTSAPADLDHFIIAFFSGRLPPAAQLEEMFTLPGEQPRKQPGELPHEALISNTSRGADL